MLDFNLQQVPPQPVPGDLPMPLPVTDPTEEPQPIEDPDVVDPLPGPASPPPLIARSRYGNPDGTAAF